MPDNEQATGVPGSLTPEERADELMMNLGIWHEPGHDHTCSRITAAIRAAVAEEREACAKLADRSEASHAGFALPLTSGRNIAAAIRARA